MYIEFLLRTCIFDKTRYNLFLLFLVNFKNVNYTQLHCKLLEQFLHFEINYI